MESLKERQFEPIKGVGRGGPGVLFRGVYPGDVNFDVGVTAGAVADPSGLETAGTEKISPTVRSDGVGGESHRGGVNEVGPRRHGSLTVGRGGAHHHLIPLDSVEHHVT